MKQLRIGNRGKSVKEWQYFLIGQGYQLGIVDSIFGQKTLAATKEFQTDQLLEPDGIVGNKTIGAAMVLGFGVVPSDEPFRAGSDWPSKPEFKPLTSTLERQDLFGEFKYRHNPLPDNPENIEVLGDWAKKNIVNVKIPQLIRIKGSPNVAFHKLAERQLIDLWDRWEKEGLIHLVLTWSGSYVPRFIRGNKKKLSNHAFGTAFDINYEWNKLGAEPALSGRKGSVRDLVDIANELGFYWGGHFSRQDGMHFEIAKLI